MLVYQPDSVNENKLLYQVAKYNFTSFLVRDFDIAIDNDDILHRMRVSGFRNYDEAMQYSRGLLSQPQVRKLMGKARPFIISVENLPLLGVAYSFDDYKKFYDVHFAPIKPSTLQLLTEPEDVVTEPVAGEEKTEEKTDGQPQGVTVAQDIERQNSNAQPVNQQTETILPAETPAPTEKKVATSEKPQVKQDKKEPRQVKKKETFDIESEDYELEGF